MNWAAFMLVMVLCIACSFVGFVLTMEIGLMPPNPFIWVGCWTAAAILISVAVHSF